MTEVGRVLFLATSVAVIVAPGPDNIPVLTRGVTLGRKAALVSAAGASVGLVIHSLFAALGLSALLAGSATAFAAVKYVGAAYLVYLSVRALLGRESFVIAEGTAALTDGQVFAQAVLSNVLNPKIAAFFLAFLPQFVVAGTAAGPQLLVLGLVFALLTLLIFGVMALRSGAIREGLRPVPCMRASCGGLLAASSSVSGCASPSRSDGRVDAAPSPHAA